MTVIMLLLQLARYTNRQRVPFTDASRVCSAYR